MNFLRPRRIAAALAALCALAAPAFADTVVTLKPALETVGETIALSDLFDGVPVEANADIARAPAPGASVTIDPVWLQERARLHGLDWPNATGVRRVSVRRASQTVSADDIARVIAEEIARRNHADYAVTLSGAQLMHAPLEVTLAPIVAAISYDPYSNSFTADVSLYPGGAPERVAGRAEPAVELPVLIRPIARGEVIAAADVTYERTPASRAPGDAIMDESNLVGMAAQRALRAGVAVRPHDLDRPAVIARGETVLIRFDRGTLSLTARARALTDVAAGDQARFVNLQSNRVVDAVAVRPGEAWLVASAPLVVR